MLLKEDAASAICEKLGVSRETAKTLHQYVKTLQKWQAKINLVSRTSLDDVWRRHILDSGQIFPILSGADSHIMDIGSGAGLPGLIIAIMRHGVFGKDATPVTLVESDQRKCAFLSVAAKTCGVSVRIINDRLEKLPPQSPDIITARALAPAEALLKLTALQHHEGLKCIFLKGENVDEELTRLKDYPNIKVKKIPSITNPNGVILTLTGFKSAKII